ncbi:hypothetical protein KEU06_28535 [Pseudaminobacter sp. 19-2017]|uniref:Uncharacterized protein n=1 Tax=Pseudaminobacter soli (ex Zhang et al. 2022) TaxID=2831468 RepID=A0A942I496_9HYPH|nr:hypothetical protein [Pseudaminobacter soli]MBS3652532.1 hypothetical protein [Pseudaminobacter soli]
MLTADSPEIGSHKGILQSLGRVDEPFGDKRHNDRDAVDMSATFRQLKGPFM